MRACAPSHLYAEGKDVGESLVTLAHGSRELDAKPVFDCDSFSDLQMCDIIVAIGCI